MKQLLARVAREERATRDREFVAPVLPGCAVAVPVLRLPCRLAVAPPDHRGWAVLRPDGAGRALVVRPASLSEISKYQERLPRFRLLLVDREGDRWSGLRATSDARLKAEVLYPVGLVTEGERFDAVCARFDGASFWYDEPDAGRDPGRAAWLREQLAAGVAPELLARPGLTPEEVRCFGHLVARARLAEDEERQRREQREQRGLERESEREGRRVAGALSHAGGSLLRLDPAGDDLQVTFEVDGHQHSARVRRRDLGVVAAGICLAGQDEDFDLASLVTVMREFENE